MAPNTLLNAYSSIFLHRLAILGLTYQFTANLIDRERYETYSSILTNEVLRLNIDPPSSSSSSTLNNANNPDDKSIRVSDEFRFMLFRHWNLYDSMYHSGYVAGKMKLYRERGRKNLQGLLAKMG
jgi:cell division control protein 45